MDIKEDEEGTDKGGKDTVDERQEENKSKLIRQEREWERENEEKEKEGKRDRDCMEDVQYMKKKGLDFHKTKIGKGWVKNECRRWVEWASAGKTLRLSGVKK